MCNTFRLGAAALLAVLPLIGGPARAADTAAVLTVYDVAEQTGTALLAPKDDFRHTLRIYVAVPEPGNHKLRIEAVPLKGPGGSSVPVTLSSAGTQPGSSFDLQIAQSGFTQFDIQATLTSLGEYAGWVTLQFADRNPIVRALRINRANPALPVEITVPARARSGDCACKLRAADLWFTVAAPADKDLEVEANVTTLERVGTGQEKIQAGPVTPGFSIDGAALADNKIALTHGTTKRVSLTFSELSQAGEYSGTVRVGAVGYTPIDRPFVLLVRDACWLAALLIGLGAVASIFIKRYGSDVRPRLVLRQRIAAAIADVQSINAGPPALDDAERDVLNAMQQQLASIASRLEDSEPLKAAELTAAQETVEGFPKKLETFVEWANASRLFAGRRVPGKDTDISKSLKEVAIALTTSGAVSADTLTKLHKLPTDIDGVFGTDLASRIDELDALVRGQQGKVSSPLTKDPAWDDSLRKLKEAKALALSDLDAASRLFNSARLTFVKLQSRDLTLRVNAGIPEGVLQASWDAARPVIVKLLSAAEAANTADAASDSYEDAYRNYLAELIEPLIRLPEEELTNKQTSTRLPPADVPAFEDLLRKTSTAAKEAEALRTQSRLREAFEKYEEALKVWHEARKKLPGGLKMSSGGPAGVGQPAASGEAVPRVAGGAAGSRLRWMRVVRAEDVTALRQRTRLLDGVLDVIALVLSVLLGIIYVWQPNATWGSVPDYIIALLWGLGLHQVAGFTFDGVLGVRKKLVE